MNAFINMIATPSIAVTTAPSRRGPSERVRRATARWPRSLSRTTSSQSAVQTAVSSLSKLGVRPR